MAKAKYKWTFSTRFRRNAFGWRSQTPIKRIKEAVSEIKKVASKDPLLAAEGAVLFLGKVAPAIQHVDSSSGYIGSAVNNAIVELSHIIAEAPADILTRRKWMDKLWQIVQDDDMPYLELLPDYWGEMCGSIELASYWADEFIGAVSCMWSDDRPGGWFKGTNGCLSALYFAERYDELLELLELSKYDWWSYRYWGTKALAAQGKKVEAIEYAQSTKDQYANSVDKARLCEEILMSDGRIEDAYSKFGLEANRKGTNLATFRAIAKKYPDKEKAVILHDLVERSSGGEGKWFATAKSIGLYAEAIELANSSPCDPRTLTRAARDMAVINPEFAMKSGLTAIRWLIAGFGYDIIGADVSSAFKYTMEAAANADCVGSATTRIRQMLEKASADGLFAVEILRQLIEYQLRFKEDENQQKPPT